MKRFLTLVVIATLLTACSLSSKNNYKTFDGFAEGTTFHIVYENSTDQDLESQIVDLLNEFDNSMSIYNPSSLVSLINNGENNVEVDPWMEECLKLSNQISQSSEGLFDITLRPLISAYGFGGEDGPRVLTQTEIDSMLQYVGYQKIKLEGNRLVKQDSRIELDFNAIAKGYSVDLVGKLLYEHGVKNYLVEIGGEVICRGKNPKGMPWLIGIDNPTEGNFVPGQDLKIRLEISDSALATSGNYRKFAYNENGEKVVHTIDPRTGRSVTHNLLSATIIAPTCAVADGYATACMVAGLDGSKKILERNPELEAYLIYAEKDGSMGVYTTSGFEKRIAE